MGSICGNVGKERLFGIRLLLDELMSLLKENVSTEAFGFFDLAIVKVGTIEVGVIPDIGSLTDAASAVAVNFFKATVFRTVRVVVTEVPFAEHCGGVIFLKMLAEGDFIFTDHGTTHNGVPDTGAIGPVAAE